LIPKIAPASSAAARRNAIHNEPESKFKPVSMVSPSKIRVREGIYNAPFSLFLEGATVKKVTVTGLDEPEAQG
jgi:hypothetical protein